MTQRHDQATNENDADAHNQTVTRLFTHIEHWITVGIGIVLIFTTLLLLTGTLAGVWDVTKHWPNTENVFLVVDKLLFVLMLVEILHTVRQSIARDQIAVEPFLIVGLIACVRRVLIVTVEVADRGTSQSSMQFDHAMIELGVLGGLVLVLIISIYMSRRSRGVRTDPDAKAGG